MNSSRGLAQRLRSEIAADPLIRSSTLPVVAGGVDVHPATSSSIAFCSASRAPWRAICSLFERGVNGYAESFHSRLRDELLNAELFTSLAEARHLANQWRLEYNHRRPHSSLGYVTPAAFAATCAAAPSAALREQQHTEKKINHPVLS